MENTLIIPDSNFQFSPAEILSAEQMEERFLREHDRTNGQDSLERSQIQELMFLVG